jgi:glutathione S-transferase
MPKPVLHVFAISHYCEKARWALDYLGIDYEINYLAPGNHRKIAKKIGASRSSLPILVADGGVVQGSAEIISWADAKAANGKTRLIPASAGDDCRALEKRIDDILGVHIRRYYYSEALVEHPQSVRPIFTKDLSFLDKVSVSMAWGVICNAMIERMDLGYEQGQESRRIVEKEIDWLDGLLSDGRKFLCCEQFSCADIAAASLLAALATPPQHPTYANLQLPPRVAEDMLEWGRRPSVNWVRETYNQYR